MTNKKVSVELTQEYLAEFLYQNVNLPKEELLSISKKFLEQLSQKLKTSDIESSIFSSLESKTESTPQLSIAIDSIL